MNHSTSTLIVGAGPFGLGLAAYLQRRGYAYQVVGKPMEFWKQHMPQGMLLRSNANWYIDPDHRWTIDAFLTLHDPCRLPTTPISREHYIAYVDWFRKQAGIPVIPAYVQHLHQKDGSFTAELANGHTIQAQNVVLATGFEHFACYPPELVALLPAGCFQHSCDAVTMSDYRGKRVLLIGGRQSAFESAALLREAGAQQVHISYRHETPRFEEANWSWVETIVEQMAGQPDWFSRLSAQQQQQYRYKLWAEGRLKVEPWLEKRIYQPEISLYPRTEVVWVSQQTDHSLRIGLSSTQQLAIDAVILATGYQVDVSRLPFLSGSIQAALNTLNGFPLLDHQFQSSVPGLYFSSFAAGQSFGPFFGFTVGVRTAAHLIGQALVASTA
ncbi:NAD(P)-binding domain-containing protein [Spirosoma endbachense]|uniref:SidA/IucD/PvdA family monooxygenase n=1 Tax=Spirosoma endbachense TaxID=2666025 RepID=A0A6P1VYR3_9BACT|nr:NAD(P)-binding domain-containing protein [Spirosoma endbachense]QHV97764.1 SidA/IucD/PvdA family monooxygenase [Spirosoma endbachense]